MDEATRQKRRRARDQAERAMRQAAQRAQPITYGQLTSAISAASYQPNEPALTDLLCAISKKEDSQQRGLLSAVVVRKDTRLPGRGFFQLAAGRGRKLQDLDDREQQRALWDAEIQQVYEAAKRA